MATTVSAQIIGQLTIQELFDSTELPGATGAGATLTHTVFNQSENLSSSSVTITEAWVTSQALSGGSATVDLTSLTDSIGQALTLSGKKIQAIIFHNPDTNQNSIQIEEGASNGSATLGDAFDVTLKPGQWILWFGNEDSEDVDATHKTWDLTGTGSQALNIALVAG